MINEKKLYMPHLFQYFYFHYKSVNYTTTTTISFASDPFIIDLKALSNTNISSFLRELRCITMQSIDMIELHDIIHHLWQYIGSSSRL
jgi:hypothetical protein